MFGEYTTRCAMLARPDGSYCHRRTQDPTQARQYVRAHPVNLWSVVVKMNKVIGEGVQIQQAGE